MSQQQTSARALLSWQVVLAISAGAWILAYSFYRIAMAAMITLTGQAIEAPPAFLPLTVLILAAALAVGAARMILNRPLTWPDFTDAKDLGPGLGTLLALLGGLFLGAVIGILVALSTGLIAFAGAPPRDPGPYTEPLLYLALWLLPAGLMKGADYLALRREQGR